MGKHLVLVGGGHAHMVALAKIGQIVDRGHRVTVIGTCPYHYYSGMGPGMLSGVYRPEQIRFETRRGVEKKGGRFIEDEVVRVDAASKVVYLSSGNSVTFDVISFNVGSYVPFSPVPETNKGIYRVKPIEGLMHAREHILALCGEKKVSVAVIGGGAASVEIAGNVRRLLAEHNRHGYQVRLFSGQGLLEQFPERVRMAARHSLTRQSIRIFENTRVVSVKPGEISCDGGYEQRADIIFLATGVRPSPIFKRSEISTGPDGGMRVNRFLQSVDHPDIFGGGDCIYFEDQPLAKVGVYAVRQNPILYHNVMAAMEKNALKAFHPGGSYLLILNMGDGTGVFFKKGILLKGKPAFIAKDLIDRRFMHRFKD